MTTPIKMVGGRRFYVVEGDCLSCVCQDPFGPDSGVTDSAEKAEMRNLCGALFAGEHSCAGGKLHWAELATDSRASSTSDKDAILDAITDPNGSGVDIIHAAMLELRNNPALPIAAAITIGSRGLIK